MKKLLTGNEAIARGFYEAGGHIAAAYPGTPSTEILENVEQYKNDIYCEWAPNEKVAMEVGIGASIAGSRTLVAMKHVGLNVAADPIMTYAYLGVNGGFVFISADDPGMHSSQNEQDNRYFAKFGKMAMVEPTDSQEAKDFVKEALEVSEKYDIPVLFRVTTRICHSKTMVELGERVEVAKKPYEKNVSKFLAAPAHAKVLHHTLEERLAKLEEYSNNSPLNTVEYGDKKIGIVTSGIAYQYAKEVFGDSASYLKIGFTHPLPFKMIEDFAKEVDTLYVIEELEPYMEEQIRARGIACIGKDKIPNVEELNPDIIAKALLGKEIVKMDGVDELKKDVIKRPPTLCAGCPHRGLFFALSKIKDVMVTGDIGCYTLGFTQPLNAMDTCVCMGGSISTGHGAAKAFAHAGEEKKIVSVIGDSTFFHTGVNSLMDVAYNKGNTVTIILDNRITGMTGHQQNPGTGFTLMGEDAKQIDIPALVKAIGIDDVTTINPLDLKEAETAIRTALDKDEPSVIITRWPCVLKKFSQQDKDEFGCEMKKYEVKEDKCKSCKLCLKTGCPALSFDKVAKIDPDMCVGCSVCAQVCPFDAIERKGE
ncbi:indolepyruvate ferredoxin oxidoreductase alpha subunit [Peptoclostridium litorale DSM 5388]|uniref:Indolepyruvate oxidoreductase subunit IorA n=1 Tax=Peptoclostridium litorale DSM 5388 TaxID=1121324 RepID=A0A069REH0_PEPLI|nr:indolepyruvate ferredoxin oxidoreductase subunit alpha [Peptoclostridium litorale]KDR95436.1 indolepyruvate oxidoreductase subunit IorA [Peptoclostridium litorale DSM 5388]SIO18787.1 indolepyruvate ferredoxin oxidoreductase alpha subunit [Peptoclostridium litorale DSM 5388]